jgi:hypothetical protein
LLLSQLANAARGGVCLIVPMTPSCRQLVLLIPSMPVKGAFQVQHKIL